MVKFHKPVLLKEAINYLEIQKGEKYIDATVGGGGHAIAILKKGGRVLGIDCDPEAVEAARERFSQACPIASWRLAQGNFALLKSIAQKEGFSQVRGILFDLGVSTHQLQTPQRGFSFNVEAPLDMRMDPGLKVTAADLVNGLNKGELNELFSKLGQEHYARQIADAICRARRLRPILTCDHLVRVILKARPKRGQFDRTHPATRCFQALRIAVNDELNSLKIALPQALVLLKPGGRLVVISFHSGEDRLVKRFFNQRADKTLKILTRKPVRPTSEEVVSNPRSRSARMRVAERLP